MATPYPYVSGAVLTAAQLNDGQNLPINDVTANYVLVNNDRYKRVIMNNAGSTTITVDNNVFVTGDVIQISNKGAGSTVVTAGAGVTINTAGSLTLAQYGGGYLLALSASTFTFFNLGAGTGYGTATGGSSSSITVGGVNYTLLTFTSTGTLTVTKAGLFDVLAISAGTAGIASFSGPGGSGVITTTTTYFDANQTVTVGAGGATAGSYDAVRYGNYSGVGTSSVSNAVLTSFAMCKADGSATCTDMSIGGGVGSGYGGTRTSTAAENYTGFRGGNGVTDAQGGGGGYSARGANGSGTTGGVGGDGYDVSAFIGGSALYKAAGGGGYGSTAGGAGGSSGVGGLGATGSGNGTSAGANTGSGGGGSRIGTTAGQGGSGIVYVRYRV
jgi:hypothetical protein